MSIVKSICGMVCIRIVSADTVSFLHYLTNNGVVMVDVVPVDELVLKLTIRRSQLDIVRHCAKIKGVDFEILDRWGLVSVLSQLKHRYLLILGIMMYFLAVCYLPCKVLFVCVEGNVLVPTGVIVDKAESAGVFFGADRKSIRSEYVKNVLLSAVPSLEWAGVNTVGCVATISVKEKVSPDPQLDNTSVCSIVAARDGIIDSISVKKGSQLCVVGQAVKKDQVLVSGYTLAENRVKLTSAEAEIFALTTRDSAALVPLQQKKRTVIEDIDTNYSLIFQKKEIKLQKGSGISGSECVKMYSKYTLTLPGGFQLPFSVIKETVISYKTESVTAEEEDVYHLAEASAKQALQDSMIAGTILSAMVNSRVEGSCLAFYGNYICREMISKVYVEEIITENE